MSIDGALVALLEQALVLRVVFRLGLIAMGVHGAVTHSPRVVLRVGEPVPRKLQVALHPLGRIGNLLQ